MSRQKYIEGMRPPVPAVRSVLPRTAIPGCLYWPASSHGNSVDSPPTVVVTNLAHDPKRNMPSVRSVLHVAPALGGLDGMSASVGSTVHALRSHTPIDVSVLVQFGQLGSAGAGSTYIVQPGAQPSRLSLAWASVIFARRLAELAPTVDLVHLHGLWRPVTLLGGPLLRNKRRPYVLSPRGMLMPAALRRKARRKAVALRLMEARNVAGALAVIVASDAEADAVRALGLNPNVHVVPNPLAPDAERYFSGIHRAARLNGERVILSVSRLHPIKRIEMLIDAFAALSGEFPQWRVEIVGPAEDSAYAGALARRIGELRLAGRIELLDGRTGDVLWATYAEADLFVLPSESENFGRVVAEALAAGIPVIATRGAPWQLLEERGCGWWVEPTVEAIRSALRSAMLSTDDSRRQMGRRGAETARERFSGRVVAQQLAALYERVMRAAPA